MTHYDVTGRTVVITGSTGGLGSALAEALRARGANLALLDLTLAATAAQAERLGGETVAKGFRADVRDIASLQTAMAQAAEHFGRIDIVIANAGIDTMAPMATLDPQASNGSSTSTSPACGAPSAPPCPTYNPTAGIC